jgi:hypothetical protein
MQKLIRVICDRVLPLNGISNLARIACHPMEISTVCPHFGIDFSIYYPRAESNPLLPRLPVQVHLTSGRFLSMYPGERPGGVAI